jgi:hypothetical protein
MVSISSECLDRYHALTNCRLELADGVAKATGEKVVLVCAVNCTADEVILDPLAVMIDEQEFELS